MKITTSDIRNDTVTETSHFCLQIKAKIEHGENLEQGKFSK